MMAHTCNAATQLAEARKSFEPMKQRLQCASKFQPVDRVRHLSHKTYKTKNKTTTTKSFGLAQWLMPVIPALREAEEDGSLEARSARPPWPTW